jgi:F-type H+-transporting ATPase subunit a
MIAASVLEPEVLFDVGPLPVTTTLAVTWGAMAVLTIVALIIRSRLNARRPGPLQIAAEALVTWFDGEIGNIIGGRPERYFPLVATLFVFILTLNLASNLPGIDSPTGDLATTAALALIVFLSVPVFGIAAKGVRGYFSIYLKPTPFMLPLNIIGELSRTLSLAVRLFGNVMSGGLIVGILILTVPIIVPAAMMALGLITSLVQAYIFAVLAMVYIGGAVQAERKHDTHPAEENG